MDYTEHATTLSSALRGFLAMGTFAPERRAQAAQELRGVLKAAEAALTPPKTTDPGYAQLLVTTMVTEQELQRYGV